MGDYNKGYRTLTVDLKTYELLEELCSIERRKKRGKLYNLGGRYVGRTFS